MIAGDEAASLREENARLRRILAFYRRVAEEAGLVLPADAPEVGEFWQIVWDQVEQENPGMFTSHDPDAS